MAEIIWARRSGQALAQESGPYELTIRHRVSQAELDNNRRIEVLLTRASRVGAGEPASDHHQPFFENLRLELRGATHSPDWGTQNLCSTALDSTLLMAMTDAATWVTTTHLRPSAQLDGNGP